MLACGRIKRKLALLQRKITVQTNFALSSFLSFRSHFFQISRSNKLAKMFNQTEHLCESLTIMEQQLCESLTITEQQLCESLTITEQKLCESLTITEQQLCESLTITEQQLCEPLIIITEQQLCESLTITEHQLCKNPSNHQQYISKV